MDALFHFFEGTRLPMVMLGCVLLCSMASLVGVFGFFRKQSLAGDAVAHATLPGLCVAFLCIAEKHTWILLLGASISGWLALVCMNWIRQHSKIKPDTAIGIVLSLSYALGIFLLTYIQQAQYTEQSGLQYFLFGSAATLLTQDIWLIGIVTLAMLILLIIYFKGFVLLSFDYAFAHSIGWPIKRLDILLTTLTVLAIVLGVQTVGVVLVVALLVIPASVAHFWTQRLRTFFILSVVFGVIAGIVGVSISYMAPQMPTGPWIVVALGVLAGLSFVWAPRRGALHRWRKSYQQSRRIAQENLLKAFYLIGEKSSSAQSAHTKTTLATYTQTPKGIRRQLKKLIRGAYIRRTPTGYVLTDTGHKIARQIVKKHRLWELYLTRYLGRSATDVHTSAEWMEHELDEALEAQLEELLNRPTQDPHNSPIPY